MNLRRLLIQSMTRRATPTTSSSPTGFGIDVERALASARASRFVIRKNQFSTHRSVTLFRSLMGTCFSACPNVGKSTLANDGMKSGIWRDVYGSALFLPDSCREVASRCHRPSYCSSSRFLTENRFISSITFINSIDIITVGE